MNKILLLQKRVLRFIYGKEYHTHSVPLFISANILPVNMLYIKTVASLMRDLSSGSLPPNIANSLFDLVKLTLIILDFQMLVMFMSINQGIINNFSFLPDSVQDFGMPFLIQFAPHLKGPSIKKSIHVLLNILII